MDKRLKLFYRLWTPVPPNSMLTPPPAGASKNLVSSCGLSTLNRGARGVEKRVDKKVSVFCPSTVAECAFPIILRGLGGAYARMCTAAETGSYYRQLCTTGSYHQQLIPAVTAGSCYWQLVPADTTGSHFWQLLLPAVAVGSYYRQLLPAVINGSDNWQ